MSTGKPSYSSPEFDTSWGEWTNAEMLFAFPLMEGSGTPVDLKSGTVTFQAGWQWTTTAGGEDAVWLQGDSGLDTGTVIFSVDTGTSNSAGTILIIKEQVGDIFRSTGAEIADDGSALEIRNAGGNLRLEVGNSAVTSSGATPPSPMDGDWEGVSPSLTGSSDITFSQGPNRITNAGSVDFTELDVGTITVSSTVFNDGTFTILSVDSATQLTISEAPTYEANTSATIDQDKYWRNNNKAEGESFTAYGWDGSDRYVYGPGTPHATYTSASVSEWESATFDGNGSGASSHGSLTYIENWGANTSYNEDAKVLAVVALNVMLTPTEVSNWFADPWGWVKDASAASVVPQIMHHRSQQGIS